MIHLDWRARQLVFANKQIRAEPIHLNITSLGRGKMNRRLILIIAVIAAASVVAGSAMYYFGIPKESKQVPTSTENVGGKYNVTLNSYEGEINWTQIEYTDETGFHSGMHFEPEMRAGLDWIKNNTPENAIFLCWWDNGHMIKGYAERNVIVRNPSHEWISMVAESWRSYVTEFDPNERLVDVAKALTTRNSTETLQIMEEYGASYVVVYRDRYTNGTNMWMFSVAGLERDQYFEYINPDWVLNEAGRQTMIVRFLDNRDTGFALVYQDTVMKVYRKD